MTTDHRLQFTEAKNLALRVISTKTRHLFCFFFYFPLFYFATLWTIWQVLWIRIDICGVNIEAGKSLVCRPLIILTWELFYHQNERTRFNGFSSCVLTIKLVPRITMLINIHITLKHIFGFKDSIYFDRLPALMDLSSKTMAPMNEKRYFLMYKWNVQTF